MKTNFLIPINILLAVSTAVLFTSACKKSSTSQSALTQPRGYLAFEYVRVGIPEENVKKAIFSFAPDSKGTFGGKDQYLSRKSDKFGGQYIVQCRDGQVYEIQVYHLASPVSHTAALATLKQLLPADLTNLPLSASKPDAKQQSGTEHYNIGPSCSADLVADKKDPTSITIINAHLATSPSTAQHKQ